MCAPLSLHFGKLKMPNILLKNILKRPVIMMHISVQYAQLKAVLKTSMALCDITHAYVDQIPLAHIWINIHEHPRY